MQCVALRNGEPESDEISPVVLRLDTTPSCVFDAGTTASFIIHHTAIVLIKLRRETNTSQRIGDRSFSHSTQLLCMVETWDVFCIFFSLVLTSHSRDFSPWVLDDIYNNIIYVHFTAAIATWSLINGVICDACLHYIIFRTFQVEFDNIHVSYVLTYYPANLWRI